MTQPEPLLTVGFIGLDDQGAPITRAIGAAGYPLHAWTRRPALLTALDGVPYTPSDSVASLAAASDLVALCLPEDSDTFLPELTARIAD